MARLVMWWSHPVCDRAEVADRCEPCRMYAEGGEYDAVRLAAAIESELLAEDAPAETFGVREGGEWPPQASRYAAPRGHWSACPPDCDSPNCRTV